MFTAVRLLSSSTVRCTEVPTPPEPKLSLPGFLRASSMSSFIVLTGTEGCTTSTLRVNASHVTGARSFSGS